MKNMGRTGAWTLGAAGMLGLAAAGYAVARRRTTVSTLPQDTAADSTVNLLAEGYTFISSRCRRFTSDVFETRLLFAHAICTMGEEAARMFYVPERFTRRGAIPFTAVKLLQDHGSVQMLEGDAHRHRKDRFLSLTSPERSRELVALFESLWRAAVPAWSRADRILLQHEVRQLLCRAVCAWAGVPLDERDVAQRTREFTAMIDNAGAIGPRNWLAIGQRARTERWIRGVIEAVRRGTLEVPEACAASAWASYRGPDGALLDANTAAVELINVLRPTIAVASYITFAALALHRFPDTRRMIDAGSDEELHAFVQEVRRFYPFFPAVGGLVRQPFEWNGHRFTEGEWVLLDIHGTNHDARTWDIPDAFRPDRFRGREANAFAPVAQGGGDVRNGHRCPGEGITLDLMKAGVRLLTRTMQYAVPPQNLHVDLSIMPALPSRFTIAHVRPIA